MILVNYKDKDWINKFVTEVLDEEDFLDVVLYYHEHVL